jgi:hypothetical protein
MEVNSPSSGYLTWNTRPAAAPAGLYVCLLARNDAFARRTCLYFLDPRRGGLQVSNGVSPFKIHGVCLLRNVEKGFLG